MDVPVYVVFEDQGGGVGGVVQEPGERLGGSTVRLMTLGSALMQVQVEPLRGWVPRPSSLGIFRVGGDSTYHCKALRWPSHARAEALSILDWFLHLTLSISASVHIGCFGILISKPVRFPADKSPFRLVEPSRDTATMVANYHERYESAIDQYARHYHQFSELFRQIRRTPSVELAGPSKFSINSSSNRKGG